MTKKQLADWRGAIECAMALELPLKKGDAIIAHHGWNKEEKYTLSPSEFVSRKLKSTLLEMVAAQEKMEKEGEK